MKTTRKERELMNAYYQSMIKREPVSWYNFPPEDWEELNIGLKSKDVLHAFDMIHDYLQVNRGGSLLSPKLWNDPYFLNLYLYSGETLNRVVREHEKDAVTSIPNEPEKVSLPEWVDDLKPLHPSMRLKIR